ncbi:MAG: polyhydroxyalkanoate depolymerase, partial [Hyphomonadaceae bacterium]
MWYHIYEAQMQASAPFRAAALAALQMRSALHGAAENPYARQLMAALEMATRAKLTHESQPFGITSVMVENREALVAEETALDLPFGRMLHFKKDIDAPQPRVLIVAPLSGHFATLLRNTVKTMLQDHDVYITDWKNARNVPLAQGRFGFEEYVDYLIKMLEHLGPGTHVVAVCQPCVQALVATAVMAADKNKCEPRSLTLMAGPIDCRINPTSVNKLATDHPIEWFRNNLISTVPFPLPAWGRRVYPGFMQLSAFISMNPERHVEQHKGGVRFHRRARIGGEGAIITFALARLGPAPGDFGHAGPGPAARRIALQTVKGGKEISHIRGPGPVAAFEHRNHGLDLTQG